MNMKKDERIRRVVDKHTAAMTREIAQILGGVTPAPQSDAHSQQSQLPLKLPQPISVKSPIYLHSRQSWTCPYCVFTNRQRRSVSAHLRYCEAAPRVAAAATEAAAKEPQKRAKK